MAITNSLIIPCYNEQDNLRALEQKLLSIPSLIDGELVLVDNGSRDETRACIQRLHEMNNNIMLVAVDTNIGYGFGILSGLKAARGTFVGWTHADGQTDALDAVKGFALIKQKPDAFIMGRRRGRPLVDLLFTIGMSIVETLLFGTGLNDIAAQPKIMTRAFFESWENPPHDFALDLFAYLTAKRQQQKIVKFPVIVAKRLHGTSSWNSGIRSRFRLISRIMVFSYHLRFP